MKFKAIVKFGTSIQRNNSTKHLAGESNFLDLRRNHEKGESRRWFNLSRTQRPSFCSFASGLNHFSMVEDVEVQEKIPRATKEIGRLISKPS
jgi:hypothetical protein